MAQMLDSPANSASLDVSEQEYFGVPLWKIDNPGGWPFDSGDGPLTRTSYVYQAIYKRGDEYGGIQLRGRVHTYGPAPDRVADWLQVSAHRAAYMYDTGIQTPGYGPPGREVRGTDSGDGYLSGFNPVESFTNVEEEAITQGEMETSPGVIDWSVEIYTDDSFNDADLSGIAQGLSMPYRLDVRDEGGQSAVDAPPHEWGLTFNESRDSYDVHPPARKKARDRYQPGGAGHDKTVYINDLPVGKLDDNGRTWLKTEYAGNPNKTSGGFGTYWSREGLVDQTGATYQALRDDGNLYMTGETEDAIYLVTAAEKPDGYQAVDPDSVSPTLRVRDGRSSRTVRLLKLPPVNPRRGGRGYGDPDAETTALQVECRRDDKIRKHMGKSNPTYTHFLGPKQRWEAALKTATGDW